VNTIYVSPTGSDANSGLDVGSALATLDKAGSKVQPGDTVQVMPGVHTGGKFYGSAANVAGPLAVLTINFQPGAKIRGGNSRSHGLTVEGWNGISILGADIADLKDGATGSGIWLAGCKNVTVKNFTIDNCAQWGIHTPFCSQVLLEDGIASRSRGQHGVYFANSCTDMTARRVKFLGNKDCGLQTNGDVRMQSDWPSIPVTGTISKLLVEDCDFAFNGVGGGANWNGDAVVGAIFRNNRMYPSRGRGNGISLFNSDYNTSRTSDVLIENNTLVVGPDKYNVLLIGAPVTGIVVRNNTLINTSFPARPTAGLIELAPGVVLAPGAVVMEGNRLSGAVVIDDSTVTTLPAIGITGPNTPADVIGTLASLTAPADPGPLVVPPPPPPAPPVVWPDLPATAPIATAADPALVDLDGQETLWCVDWVTLRKRGTDFVKSATRNLSWDGMASPLSGMGRYGDGEPKGFGARWRGFIRVPTTGVYEIGFTGKGYFDCSFAGDLILEGTAGLNGHDNLRAVKFYTLESGKFYAIDIGVSIYGDYAQAVLSYRSAANPLNPDYLPNSWLFPPKLRPAPAVPAPAPAPAPIPAPAPGPSPAPAPAPASGSIFDHPEYARLLELFRALGGK
jgi:hypothetical protein